MKKLGVLISILLLLTALALGSYIFYRKYQASKPSEFEISLLPEEENPPVWNSDKDYLQEKEIFEASVSAQAYIVLDTTSNTVLLEKNSQKTLAPASTTKLMTTLVASQLYDLDEVVVVATSAAVGHDGGGLFAQEKVLVKDLIAAALISSANDAALALAYHNNQPELFYTEMNKMAQALNLDNTVFTNAAGYDGSTHLSTARDLAILIRTAYEDPALKEYMGLESYVVENTDKTIRHFLFTTNEFLGSHSDVKAGKTGTTENAGEVLASVIENGHDLVIVVMGSYDRYVDTRKLMQFVVEHF